MLGINQIHFQKQTPYMLKFWNRISLNRSNFSQQKISELQKLENSFIGGSKRKSHAQLKYNNLCVHKKKNYFFY